MSAINIIELFAKKQFNQEPWFNGSWNYLLKFSADARAREIAAN